MRRSPLMAFMAALTALAGASPAFAYDPSWYKAEFWGGEYPHGFTMTEDATTPIRAEPDQSAARSLDCALEKNATYHPWNAERLATSGLEFVTYSRTVTYQVSTPLETEVYRQSDDAAQTLSLRAGDRWTYLTYLGEGMFLMSFGGETYSADQELIEASKEAGDGAVDSTPDDEWMKLSCANGEEGWLLLGDVAGAPGFGEPNIIEYGKAEDAH